MVRHRFSAVIGLVLMSLPGCAGREHVDPLVVIAGPKGFTQFEVRDADDRLIWHVVANAPAPVAELYYGELPAGFHQETPADRVKPRPLAFGEFLSLRSVTPRRIFHHEGYVSSHQQLSIEYWEMNLRNPPAPAVPDDAPTPPELDDAPAPP